jgi:hypothetical protein
MELLELFVAKHWESRWHSWEEEHILIQFQKPEQRREKMRVQVFSVAFTAFAASDCPRGTHA